MKSKTCLWVGLSVAAAAAVATAALVCAARTPKGDPMADLRARLHHLLWHAGHSDLSAEVREAYEQEVVQILVDHPELDAFFLDRYITRYADEWELSKALRALAYLGRRRPFDHAPLVGHRG